MSEGTVIRPARLDEHDALDQIMRRAAFAIPEYRDRLTTHPDSLFIPRELFDSGRVLVAERDGHRAGFAAWLPIGEVTAEVQSLFVDLPWWEDGVGTDLLQAITQAASQSRFKQLYVAARPKAEHFYRRNGFVRAGVTATQFGPALTMLIEIPD